MSKNVLAILEHSEGKLTGSALELITAATQLAAGLGGEAHGVVLGKGVGEVAQAAAGHGMARVLVGDAAVLEPYSPMVWGAALGTLIADRAPAAVLMTHSNLARDLAARLAVRLDGAVATDCTSVKAEGEGLVAERPVYAGKLIATVELSGSGPKVVSLRPKSYDKAPEGGSAEVETVEVAVEADPRLTVQSLVAKSGGKVSLTEADIVVSAGRAIKGPENFGIVEELAEVLGAAVGASRAVVDAGWRGHADQVGQTGKVVAPKLYIAAGISGAIQHLVGMQNSKFILAINTNRDAPIFKKADFGIEGDLFEVLPELTKAFKEATGR